MPATLSKYHPLWWSSCCSYCQPASLPKIPVLQRQSPTREIRMLWVWSMGRPEHQPCQDGLLGSSHMHNFHLPRDERVPRQTPAMWIGLLFLEPRFLVSIESGLPPPENPLDDCIKCADSGRNRRPPIGSPSENVQTLYHPWLRTSCCVPPHPSHAGLVQWQWSHPHGHQESWMLTFALHDLEWHLHKPILGNPGLKLHSLWNEGFVHMSHHQWYCKYHQKHLWRTCKSKGLSFGTSACWLWGESGVYFKDQLNEWASQTLCFKYLHLSYNWKIPIFSFRFQTGNRIFNAHMAMSSSDERGTE